MILDVMVYIILLLVLVILVECYGFLHHSAFIICQSFSWLWIVIFFHFRAFNVS